MPRDLGETSDHRWQAGTTLVVATPRPGVSLLLGADGRVAFGTGPSAIGEIEAAAELGRLATASGGAATGAAEAQASPVQPRLPWTPRALAPELVALVCAESAHRRRILEFGPGVSTEMLLRFAGLRQAPLEVTAVEENAGWAGEVRAACAPALADARRLSVIVAPLTAYAGASPFPISRWYDKACLSALGGAFDMVLVDGPTAYTDAWRYDRWPALEVALPLLADRGLIILDDAERSGEAEIAVDWLARLGSPWRARSIGRSIWFSRA